jgi:hypothetical protein
VNLLSRSRMVNVNRPARSPTPKRRLQACWAVQAPSGRVRADTQDVDGPGLDARRGAGSRRANRVPASGAGSRTDRRHPRGLRSRMSPVTARTTQPRFTVRVRPSASRVKLAVRRAARPPWRHLRPLRSGFPVSRGLGGGVCLRWPGRRRGPSPARTLLPRSRAPPWRGRR